MKFTLLVYFFFSLLSCATMSKSATGTGSISKFSHWRTGKDSLTVQLIPITGHDPLVDEDNKIIVHVKFNVKQYGEVSFPISNETLEGTEALKVDLSKSKSIRITYKSNQKLVVQLRQTGVHGGVHNHIRLPTAKEYISVVIPFTEFKGGMKPLDLTNVAKFNFAFLSNNELDGYAELKIRDFEIDGYEK